MGNVVDKSKEPLHVVFVPWCLPLVDSGHLVRVHVDAIVIYDVT